MSQIDAQDEGLLVLKSALGTWAGSARGILAQATATTNALRHECEQELRRRTARLGALQASLNACRLPEDRVRLQRAVQRAQDSAARARRAHAQACAAADDLRILERRLDATIGGRIPAAQSDLMRRLDALSGYRDGSSQSSSSTSGGASLHTLGKAFADRGLTDVPISNAKFDDNPIIDGYHKGGASQTDYRWAVETWDSVVRPGVLRGATHEDFERRDAARAAPEFRRTAAVYDMFMGDDRLIFSSRGDGALDVTNGRHRVEVARSLGISHLPGRVS
jgi:hypothetical protein